MISDTLYARYIDERQGLRVLEQEHGFLTYRIEKNECFIMDMYVRKEYRRAGYGTKLIESLEQVCEGCDAIFANIWLWDPNCNGTMAGALATGFKLFKTGEGVITVAKDLRKGK